MIRLLFAIVGGVLLGGVVHLVSVLALPRIATQDAYSRLTPMTKENAVTALPLAEPNNAPMPFMDPAFAVAICRYDLSGGPLKLTVPVSPRRSPVIPGSTSDAFNGAPALNVASSGAAGVGLTSPQGTVGVVNCPRPCARTALCSASKPAEPIRLIRSTSRRVSMA